MIKSSKGNFHSSNAKFPERFKLVTIALKVHFRSQVGFSVFYRGKKNYFTLFDFLLTKLVIEGKINCAI